MTSKPELNCQVPDLQKKHLICFVNKEKSFCQSVQLNETLMEKICLFKVFQTCNSSHSINT